MSLKSQWELEEKLLVERAHSASALRLQQRRHQHLQQPPPPINPELLADIHKYHTHHILG